MWHKIRRLGALLAVPLGIAVLVAVLLIQPWEGGDEATGAVIEYRFCNLIVKAPASDKLGDLQVIPVTGDWYGDPDGRPALEIGIDHGASGSWVELDAQTGATVSDAVLAADSAAIGALLATKRVDNDPPTFWPYTDAVQIPAARSPGQLSYRSPDPGSGLIVINRSGLPPSFRLKNCQSEMRIIGKEGGGIEAPDYSAVAAEDMAAFEAFAAEARYVE